MRNETTSTISAAGAPAPATSTPADDGPSDERRGEGHVECGVGRALGHPRRRTRLADQLLPSEAARPPRAPPAPPRPAAARCAAQRRRSVQRHEHEQGRRARNARRISARPAVVSASNRYSPLSSPRRRDASTRATRRRHRKCRQCLRGDQHRGDRQRVVGVVVDGDHQRHDAEPSADAVDGVSDDDPAQPRESEVRTVHAGQASAWRRRRSTTGGAHSADVHGAASRSSPGATSIPWTPARQG